MPLNCPVCRAANDHGPSCRRCRADLSLLFAVEANREWLLAEARRELAQERPVLASLMVQRAKELRDGADIAQFAAVLALRQHDFATAWHEYRRVCRFSGG